MAAYRHPFSANMAGLARAMEFILVFPRRGDYEKLKAGDTALDSSFVHEWVHYFQFVSTNVGHLFVELHQSVWVARRLLTSFMQSFHGWDFSVPALEWPHADDSTGHKSVSVVEKYLEDLDRVLNEQFTYFGVRGYEPSPYAGVPEVTILSSQEHVEGRVRLGDWDGTVTPLQIMEHASVTGEYWLGGFPLKTFFDPSSADYYFAYWYLQQRGVIDLSPKDERTRVVISRCSYDRDPISVPLLVFLFAQIALNSAELINFDFTPSEEWRKRADPNNFLIKARAMGSTAGAVFCDLLVDFDACARIAIEMFDKTGSWIRSADAVCALRGLPSYQLAIDVGIRRLNEYQEKHAGDLPPEETLEFLMRTSKKVMLTGLENLRSNEFANVNPVTSPGALPFPKCLAFSSTGERHLVSRAFRGQASRPTFVDISKTAVAFLLEEERVLEGLCLEHAIPCYPHVEDDALAEAFAVWPCDQFEPCRRAWAAGRSDFCVNTGWQSRRQSMQHALRSKK